MLFLNAGIMYQVIENFTSDQVPIHLGGDPVLLEPLADRVAVDPNVLTNRAITVTFFV